MAVQINIGCGTAPTAGWINYDNSPAVRLARSRLLGAPAVSWMLRRLGLIDAGNLDFAAFCRAHGIRWADAVSRIPHDTATVDVVYASHMIEHLDRREARLFLQECRRVLRPGGVLRLAVPDLSVTVRDYVQGGNAEIFMEQLLLDLDKPRGFGARLRRLLLGGRDHHWMYDGRSLARLVASQGFDDVAVQPPGATRIADPGKLDLREREGDSVFVEAVRPGSGG